MATQQAGNPRQILSQIVQRIGDLSQALISDQSPEVNNGVLASNNTLEDEVRSVFTGHRAGSTGPVSSIEVADLQTSSTTTVAQRQLPVPLVNCSSRNTTTPSYNVRRYFNNQRRAITNRRSLRSSSAPNSSSYRPPRRGRRGTTGPFTRDLILLSGPDDKNVPRQGTKLFLQENGHIISAFQFMKEWSDIEVTLQIAEALKDKLPTGVDFEILHSVHTTLVAPTLASGQNLNGSVMSRVFRDNKPVYVRPSMQILKQEYVEVEQPSLASDIFDDEFPDLSDSKYQLILPMLIHPCHIKYISFSMVICFPSCKKYLVLDIILIETHCETMSGKCIMKLFSFFSLHNIPYYIDCIY